MIYVIAVVTARPGQREEILKAFHANTPAVRAEAGCIEYRATVDARNALPMQTPYGEDTFVVIEKWEDMNALEAHAASAHMAAYGAATRGWIAGRTIHILSPLPDESWCVAELKQARPTRLFRLRIDRIQIGYEAVAERSARGRFLDHVHGGRRGMPHNLLTAMNADAGRLDVASQLAAGIASPRATAGRATNASSTRVTWGKSEMPTSSPAP